MAIEIEIDLEGKSIIELRNQLKGLKNDLSAATDPAEMTRLAEGAGKITDKMKDLNEQVAVFAAGSKFEQASIAIGQIGGDLGNLDFEGAAEKAAKLTQIVKGITFTEATKGLSQLGSTFLNLGKALLTNPLFLIATIITGIVLVIKELIDAIGVTQAIMNAFGKVMKVIGDILNTFIIEPLKAVADWLGITSNAADEAADKEVEAAERKKVAYQDAHNAIINNLENEIKVRKAAGEDTTKLEAKLLNEKRTAIKDGIEQDRRSLQAKQSKLKNSKQLTEEEVDALKKETKELQDKIKADKLSYKNATGDIKAFYADKKKEREDDKKEDKEKAEDDAKKSAEDAKAAAKAARDAAKERKSIRVQLARELVDIELSMMVEGQAKEEAILEESFKRQIEDTLNNESLNASQRLIKKTALLEQEEFQLNLIRLKWLKIKEDSEKQSLDKVAKYQKDKYAKDKQNRIDDITDSEQALKDQTDAKILRAEVEVGNDEFNFEKKKALLELQKQKEIEETMATGDAKLLIEQKYAAKLTSLEEAEKARARALVDAKLAIASSGFDLLSNLTELFNNGSEKSAKNAFNVNKAVGIAQATIQTYQAAQAAYLSQLSIPSPDATIRASIAAGVAVAAGVANIAKISQTQYKGSTTPSSSNPLTNTSSAATPSYNLFGNNNNQNNVNASNNQPINIQNEVKVKAYVSETEITDSQRRVERYRSSSEL